jgi:hypothetical protein
VGGLHHRYSGSGLKEAAQESDEVQTDAGKGQRGMPKTSCSMGPESHPDA